MVTRSAGHRAIAAALAALWLAVPLGAVADGVTEVHEYCAEHGAVEHAPVGAPATSRHAVTSPSGRDHHDACSFDRALVRIAAHVDAPQAARGAGAAPVVQVGRLAEVTTGDLLHVAPKTSPPAS
ncbi:MAG: hypothetical protein D6689_06080 [Deltaproteobacteria bacterium]|nr:MAG: hypothetical protein D6689_06080 [Deltaproteobacteria bacterium]